MDQAAFFAKWGQALGGGIPATKSLTTYDPLDPKQWPTTQAPGATAPGTPGTDMDELLRGQVRKLLGAGLSLVPKLGIGKARDALNGDGGGKDG